MMEKKNIFAVTLLAILLIAGILLYRLNSNDSVILADGSIEYSDVDTSQANSSENITNRFVGKDYLFSIKNQSNFYNRERIDYFSNSGLKNSNFVDNEIILTSTSALDIIDTLSLSHNWNDEEKFGNMRIWHEACRGTEQYFDSDIDPNELMAFDARAGYLKLLSEYCKDVSLYYEIEVLGKFLDHSEGENRNLSIDYGFTSAINSFGNEHALEYAGSRISEALQRQEEDRIYRLLFLISSNKLLIPILNEDNANYNFLYENVISEVSAALICVTLDGCVGLNHPMILRQCVRRNQTRGVGCVNPRDLNDAIYQTLSPPEYQAFISFYGQIIRLIQE